MTQITDPTQLLKTIAASGLALYDAIMQTVEPDLLSTAIPHLAEKYAGETREQRKKRMQRYAKAFDAFVRALSGHQSELHSTVQQFEQTQRGAMEQSSIFMDVRQMELFEEDIEAFPSDSD